MTMNDGGALYQRLVKLLQAHESRLWSMGGSWNIGLLTDCWEVTNHRETDQVVVTHIGGQTHYTYKVHISNQALDILLFKARRESLPCRALVVADHFNVLKVEKGTYHVA